MSLPAVRGKTVYRTYDFFITEGLRTNSQSGKTVRNGFQRNPKKWKLVHFEKNCKLLLTYHAKAVMWTLYSVCQRLNFAIDSLNEKNCICKQETCK